jgi:hypothetical protein
MKFRGPQALNDTLEDSLEDFFHLMVVISIQTTNLLGFLGALQLSAHKAELRTVVGLNAQPAVTS